MRPVVRRAIALLLKVAFVGAALLFLARGVAWAEVARTLRGANILLLGGVVVINFGMMALKASRLRLLLGKIPLFSSCFLAKLTASAINNVLPLRGGDMARLWMLERHAGITKSAAAAVAVVEILFEMISLGVVALVGALAIHQQRWIVGTTLTLLGVAALLIWLALRTGNARPHPAHDPVWERSPGGRLHEFLERIRPGLVALRNRRVVATVVAMSLGMWLLEVTMVVPVRARDPAADRNGPALATIILLGINLAIALPSMPASAGTFEGGASLVLVLSGIAKGPAVAFALLYHAIQVVPVTIAGLGVVSRVGLTLDRLPAFPSGADPAAPEATAVVNSRGRAWFSRLAADSELVRSAIGCACDKDVTVTKKSRLPQVGGVLCADVEENLLYAFQRPGAGVDADCFRRACGSPSLRLCGPRSGLLPVSTPPSPAAVVNGRVYGTVFDSTFTIANVAVFGRGAVTIGPSGVASVANARGSIGGQSLSGQAALFQGDATALVPALPTQAFANVVSLGDNELALIQSTGSSFTNTFAYFRAGNESVIDFGLPDPAANAFMNDAGMIGLTKNESPTDHFDHGYRYDPRTRTSTPLPALPRPYRRQRAHPGDQHRG